MVFCPHCRAQTSGGAFCTSCGKSLPPVAVEDSANVRIESQPAAGVTSIPQPVTQKRSPAPFIGGGVAAVGLIGIIAFSISAGPTILERAHEECVGNDSFQFGISIDDDGKGMFVDMEGEEDLLGASYSDVICVLEAVDTPSSVLSQMSNTTSLMGIQTASWDGLSASWSYHPDRGLDVSLRLD